MRTIGGGSSPYKVSITSFTSLKHIHVKVSNKNIFFFTIVYTVEAQQFGTKKITKNPHLKQEKYTHSQNVKSKEINTPASRKEYF